jgi:hypothetical protein
MEDTDLGVDVGQLHGVARQGERPVIIGVGRVELVIRVGA